LPWASEQPYRAQLHCKRTGFSIFCVKYKIALSKKIIFIPPYTKNFKSGAQTRVSKPANTIDNALIEPSTSPNSIAFDVPIIFRL